MFQWLCFVKQFEQLNYGGLEVVINGLALIGLDGNERVGGRVAVVELAAFGRQGWRVVKSRGIAGIGGSGFEFFRAAQLRISLGNSGQEQHACRNQKEHFHEEKKSRDSSLVSGAREM